MTLAPHEKHNPLWIKLKAHMEARLDSLRTRNDGDMDATQTANLRGRIAEIKALMSLADEKPIIKE